MKAEEIFRRLDDELEQVSKLDLYKYLESIYPATQATLTRIISRNRNILFEICTYRGFIIKRTTNGRLWLIRAEGDLEWYNCNGFTKVHNTTPDTMDEFLERLEEYYRKMYRAEINKTVTPSDLLEKEDW